MAVSVSKSVDIRASVSEVMEVLADVASLPRWSSPHQSAEIVSADPEGWPLQVRAKVKQFGIADEMLLDYTWYDGEVSWRLAEPSTAQKVQNATYTLSDNGDGTTHVDFELEVEPRIKVPGLVIKQAQKLAADIATKGLKDECEKRYA